MKLQLQLKIWKCVPGDTFRKMRFIHDVKNLTFKVIAIHALTTSQKWKLRIQTNIYRYDTYHVGKKSSGLELSKEGITSSFQKTYLDISLPAFLQCSSIISEMFFLGELQLIFNRMTFTERVRCFPNDLGSQKLKQLPGIGYFN